jgi:hypothetical protein
MKVLLLMSSLRAGSHMVRSMLRDEPTIRDIGSEHVPLSPSDVVRLGTRGDTTLVPPKYGMFGFIRHCLDLTTIPNACALLLHRRDAAAQARSLAHARRYGSWFGPVESAPPIQVKEAEVTAHRDHNARDLAMIRAAMQIPYEVLAYEDISVETLKASLVRLLCRDVLIVEPSTVKVAG